MVTYGLVAVAGCQVFYFNAVQTLSVGVALLLEYLGIVLVVVWLWARHGQWPQGWTVLGIVASVTGLVLVLEVASGLTVDVAGVLWGLGAAVGLAVYFVISADESTGLPPIVMAAGAMVVGAVALVLTGLVGILPMEPPASTSSSPAPPFRGSCPCWAWAIVAGAFAYSTGSPHPTARFEVGLVRRAHRDALRRRFAWLFLCRRGWSRSAPRRRGGGTERAPGDCLPACRRPKGYACPPGGAPRRRYG